MLPYYSTSSLKTKSAEREDVLPPNQRYTLEAGGYIWTPGWVSATTSRGFSKSPSVVHFNPFLQSSNSRARNLYYHHYAPPTSARISLKTLVSLRRNNLISPGSKSRYYYHSVIQVIYYTFRQIIQEIYSIQDDPNLHPSLPVYFGFPIHTNKQKPAAVGYRAWETNWGGRRGRSLDGW